MSDNLKDRLGSVFKNHGIEIKEKVDYTKITKIPFPSSHTDSGHSLTLADNRTATTHIPLKNDKLSLNLWNSYCVIVQNDTIYLKGSSRDQQDSQILFFNNETKTLQIDEDNFNEDCHVYPIHGIVGFLTLEDSPYLVFIAKRKRVGKIFSKSIFRIEKIGVVPLDDVQKALVILNNLRSMNSDEESDTNVQAEPLLGLPVQLEDLALTPNFNEFENPNSSTNNPSLSSTTSSSSRISSSLQMHLASSITAIKNVTNRVLEKSTETAKNVVPIFSETLQMKIINELLKIFNAGTFYYSSEYDITNTLQRRSGVIENSSLEESTLNYNDTIDKRFFWNENLMKPFTSQNLEKWVCPIMQGFVEIEKSQIQDFNFDFVLISRRSRERAGLRYERRGVDDLGNAANFVETEQIVILNEHTVSFVQTRGSIPLLWSQKNAGNFKPIPVLTESNVETQKIATLAHFGRQLNLYGNVLAINLVEQKGRESIVGQLFKENLCLLNLPKVSYIEFDFHEKCSIKNYDRLEELMEMIEFDLSNTIGYYWENDTEIYCRQKGVFRTNCMDCLDRTNVVQSLIARKVFTTIMLRIGIHAFADASVPAEVFSSFESCFKTVWANNGDQISQAYTGTIALKSDFTRTGKRNIQGLLNDAQNSISRMYQNQFKDGFRQATIDFFLGNRDYSTMHEFENEEYNNFE